MSNNLLHKEVRKNPIHLVGKSRILTDELFGIVKLSIKENGLIWVAIYNQLNYSSAEEVQSHHESHGTFFYNNPKRSVYIMLDAEKCVQIDKKHDNLRKSLYYKR